MSSSDGLSFIPVPDIGGVGLVPQAHGGALMRGGTPEGHAKGGRVAAERRRARAERSEAVDDAMVGHVEKMSAIIGDLVKQAGGEQHRCANCGALGLRSARARRRSAAARPPPALPGFPTLSAPP